MTRTGRTGRRSGAPRRALRGSAVLVAAAVLAAACGDGAPEEAASPERDLTVYTSVTQETVDAVVDAYRSANPGANVSVFRAPTGQLNARIASDLRAGGIRADVIWGTDPLSVQQWDAQDLLAEWTPENVENVPPEDRSERFWGTRVLHMVLIHRPDLDPAPAAWGDLTDPAYRDSVVIPDPRFAGSAFATLGYFAQAPGFGMDFYRELRENGAVEVSSPEDVVTDVAEGRREVGIALGFSARAAAEKGSPIEIVWPDAGAISLYSPIAVFRDAGAPEAARAFVEFVLSEEGQRAIARTGWHPVLETVEGPPTPPHAPEVRPDWETVFDRQEELLREYSTIFPA